MRADGPRDPSGSTAALIASVAYAAAAAEIHGGLRRQMSAVYQQRSLMPSCLRAFVITSPHPWSPSSPAVRTATLARPSTGSSRRTAIRTSGEPGGGVGRERGAEDTGEVERERAAGVTDRRWKELGQARCRAVRRSARQRDAETIISTAPTVPAPSSGAITRPKTAIAAFTQMSMRRRPRSARTAEIGIVSAKNRSPNSCMTRNCSRL